jgi:acyl-CoA synthetase (AMP-forming)/AMP-acid ligase II
VNVTRLFASGAGTGTLTHVRSGTHQTSRTFSEVLANVAKLRASLQRLGLRSGDPVLILCGSRIEAVEMILAAFNLGATAMPLSPLLGSDAILAIIEHTRPRCCLLEDPPDERLLHALRERDCLLICLRDAPPAHRYDRLLALPAAPLDFPELEDGHPALVIHGSGSSGRVKAVAMSHGALCRFFEYHDFVYSQYSEARDSLRGTSAILTGLPLTHLAGLATCLQGLLSGRDTYLLSLFVPELYLKLVEAARCCFIMLVPSLYRRLLKEPYLQRMDRSALRYCITGGEPCSPDLLQSIELAFGVPLVTAYSMTECLSGIGHSRQELFDRRIKPASCGRQLFGELRLCDAQGREQPDLGELWIRNATVHRCYLDAALNEARIVDGWFKTGDLFYRDAAGEFFHRGRVDDMFICNGKNIYPTEIELLLMRHAAIESACAAPVASAEKGVIPAVLIVSREPISEAEIQEFAMRFGPSHAAPQLVKFVSALPQLGPGKIDRGRVARILQEACAGC